MCYPLLGMPSFLLEGPVGHSIFQKHKAPVEDCKLYRNFRIENTMLKVFYFSKMISQKKRFKFKKKKNFWQKYIHFRTNYNTMDEQKKRVLTELF